MSAQHPDNSNPQSVDQQKQHQISPHRQHQHQQMAQDLPSYVVANQEIPPMLSQQDLMVHHQDHQSKQQQTKPRKKDSYENTVVSSGSRLTRFKQLSTRRAPSKRPQPLPGVQTRTVSSPLLSGAPGSFNLPGQPAGIPAPPYSAGPYMVAAPVHKPKGYDDDSDHNHHEDVWKDFPPLQLPPVHLPAGSSYSAKNSNESKVNGHQVKNMANFGLTSPGQYMVVDEVEDHPGRRKNSGFLQPMKHLSADPEGPGCCALLLALVSILLIIATLPFSLCMCIKVVQEYERSVIFRLGRLRKGGAKGPGIFFIIPCIDTYRKVDLRTVSFDVPPQEVLSRDSVTVTVDAVVYYRVSNPTMATNNVEDFSHSTHLLAATTLRNVLGTKHLAEILSERETISHVMEQTLDEATDPWGVKVERVEIKDVRLPVQLQRAMAAEAEAAREARAKVIAAEGEQKASRALREAADVISESPSAIQLRYLQTLNTISAEKNSTIIFPVPMDIISHFLTKKEA